MRQGLRNREQQPVQEIRIGSPPPRDFEKWAKAKQREWALKNSTKVHDRVPREGDDELKAHVISWLDGLCNAHFSPIMDEPLGEAFCYEGTAVLNEAFPGSLHRDGIIQCLQDPGSRLECKCCQDLGKTDMASSLEVCGCILPVCVTRQNKRSQFPLFYQWRFC